jgi:hypothetical protein
MLFADAALTSSTDGDLMDRRDARRFAKLDLMFMYS